MATAAASTRRIGAESSATRALILEAAEAVMREDGYGATSTRAVAKRAGLKPSLVHYYFPTTEDLLLAVFRKGAEQSDEWLEAALSGPDPLRALWRMLSDTSRNELTLEMMALANHRPAIRAEIAEHSERMRARQVEALVRMLGDRLSGPGGCPPAALTVILAGIGRALMMEGGFGVKGGHDEAREWVEQWLAKLAPDQGC
jgi:AcrR family transcriptional regulator